MVRRRAQVKTLLCFRLRLVSLYTLQKPSLRKGRSTIGGGLPYHISYGDVFAGVADIAVRFKALHAQCNASAHNGSVAGSCAPGKSSQAWIRPAMAVVSIKPSARSATPLYLGLSAVVNSCLMHRDLHRSPSMPPRFNAPIGSYDHHL